MQTTGMASSLATTNNNNDLVQTVSAEDQQISNCPLSRPAPNKQEEQDETTNKQVVWCPAKPASNLSKT
jgi:hypothetical protein